MIKYYHLNTNNLKDLEVEFPENKLIAVTGVSGSGKSSLVFESIYALSKNAYMDLMFPELNSLGKKLNSYSSCECNKILPAVSMKQIKINHNVRSTVGTLTDISKMLRQLFTIILNSEGHRVVPAQFSPNTPQGACPKCAGLGKICDINLNKIVDARRSISDGAIIFWERKSEKDLYKNILLKLSEMRYLNSKKIISDYSDEEYNFLLYGNVDDRFEVKFRSKKGILKKKKVAFLGILDELITYKNSHSIGEMMTGAYKDFFSSYSCDECCGSGINYSNVKEKICGLNYIEVETLTMHELKNWLEEVSESYLMAKEIITVIIKKVYNLIVCNIEYLSLNRRIVTLSGGEYQRLRLANVISDSVSNMLFVFDEPTAGLHPKDIDVVIENIMKIRKNNNTVMVVEHNNQIINKCDYVIDIGPYAGNYGGNILYSGSVENFKDIKESITLKYKKGISLEIKQDSKDKDKDKKIFFKNLNTNNIKNLSVDILENNINIVVGVSGSGKSTLLNLIENHLISNRYTNNYKQDDNAYRIVKVEQTPISKNSRSIVATYLNIYDEMRKLLSNCENKKGKKHTSSFFSFNVKGGRCENCNGNGFIKYELDFMDDIFIECEVCRGKRFNEEALSVKWNDMNVYEMLELTVQEALDIFANNKKIFKILNMMNELGLGYIKLGQPSNSLSGGESQRIKLVSELCAIRRKKTIYLLDEPTMGLHLHDVEKLYKVFLKLRDSGDTIIIADHNIEFIKLADNIIEMGPGSAQNGGTIIATGGLKDIVKCKESVIGSYLNKLVK